MKKIVVFGAGGHARVISDIVVAEGNRVIAFLDDNISVAGSSGPIADYTKYRDCEFIIGIGDADIREKLSSLKVKWHTAIHPSAVVSKKTKIGQGTVVMPNAVINNSAVIGDHCIINSGAIVEHDCVISDFCHISVGAKLGGSVVIGRKSWIGIGANIINNVSLHENVFIGAGATVINNIVESGVYIGVPSKKLK